MKNKKMNLDQMANYMGGSTVIFSCPPPFPIPMPMPIPFPIGGGGE